MIVYVCVDVVEKLEEERQQLQDWEARLSFTEDIRASQQVR